MDEVEEFMEEEVSDPRLMRVGAIERAAHTLPGIPASHVAAVLGISLKATIHLAGESEILSVRKVGYGRGRSWRLYPR